REARRRGTSTRTDASARKPPEIGRAVARTPTRHRPAGTHGRSATIIASEFSSGSRPPTATSMVRKEAGGWRESPVNRAAGAGGLGPGVDPGRNDDVFQGDAERLEQGDVLRVGPAVVAADDDLAQLADLGPVQRAGFQGLGKVAGLDPGLVAAI